MTKTWFLIFVIRGVESITSGHIPFDSQEACQTAATQMYQQLAKAYYDPKAVIFCAEKWK